MLFIKHVKISKSIIIKIILLNIEMCLLVLKGKIKGCR